MKLCKFILAFFLVFLFYVNFNILTLNGVSKDNTPPEIKIIAPHKSEEYIISKPTIKATFSDKTGVDLSSIKLYVNNKDVTKKAQITKNSIKYTPDKKFKRGTQIAKITLCDKEKNKSELQWHFIVGTPVYKNFKGLFFDADDTLISCDDLYKSPTFDKPNDFCIVSSSIDTSKKNLNDFKTKFKKYNSNCKLALLDNFKTPIVVSNDEIYIYNIKDNNNYKNLSKLDINKIYKKLFLEDDLICGFNPKQNNLNSFDYMKYSDYGDRIFSLIDITDDDENSKETFYLGVYNEALNNGWHISPVTTKFTTKILSTDLNEDSLYDGLKNRRTYATNSENLNLEFNINGYQMGSIIKNPSKLNFCISAVDSKKSNTIKNIYVMSNNDKIIKNINCYSNMVKSDFTLKEFEKYSFYYLVIHQTGGKTTVSSPIWIESD